jgi:hypothetical protein
MSRVVTCSTILLSCYECLYLYLVTVAYMPHYFCGGLDCILCFACVLGHCPCNITTLFLPLFHYSSLENSALFTAVGT